MQDHLHQIEEGHFVSAYHEKTSIYFKHYLPKGKLPKKIVHLIFQHGMIEYHLRNQDFFDILRRENPHIVISVMDLYGHGLSGGYMGHIDQF